MDTQDAVHTTMRAGQLAVTVWPESPAGRHQRYGYRVRDTSEVPSAGHVVEGRDLFTGTTEPVDPDAAIRLLAGYLSNAAENEGMFPDWLTTIVREHPAAITELAAWEGPAHAVTQIGPGEGLARQWLHIVYLDAGDDESTQDLLDDIERGALDQVLTYLKEHDLGDEALDAQDIRNLTYDQIDLYPSGRVVTDDEYVLVYDTKNGYLDFYRKIPPASVEPERWISVVFLQGPEADAVLDLIERQGSDAAIEYLAGYDWGEETVQAALGNGYVYDDLPTGTVDEVAHRDVYTLTYNHHLGHVHLLRDHDVMPDPALLGIDNPHPPRTAPTERLAARHAGQSRESDRDWFAPPSAGGTGGASRGLSL